MIKPDVYILAGGQSRRFGSDKSRIVIDGVSMIQRLAEAVENFATSITVVVACDDTGGDRGLRTITDRQPGLGPMGGLWTALGDTAEPWILVLSCDWHGLDPAWIAHLLESAQAGDRAVLYGAQNRLEPLMALYARDLLPEVEAAVRAGDLALHRLVERVGARILPLPANWAQAINMNTPGDFQKIADSMRDVEQ